MKKVLLFFTIFLTLVLVASCSKPDEIKNPEGGNVKLKKKLPTTHRTMDTKTLSSSPDSSTIDISQNPEILFKQEDE